MDTFNPQRYGPVVASLLDEPRLMPLGPGRPESLAATRLDGLSPEDLFGKEAVPDRNMAAACLAGLWLYFDDLDESHRLSQEIETPTGSYWHGLMHRRERDFGNAKYWFRRVGGHPVFPAVAAAASALDAGGLLGRPLNPWDPFAFVDCCEAALAGRSPTEMLCRQVQQREWEILFDYCYRNALTRRGG